MKKNNSYFAPAIAPLDLKTEGDLLADSLTSGTGTADGEDMLLFENETW